MIAYKNPIGAVVKNNTKAIQKSNKLLNKGIGVDLIIKYFLEKFQLEKSSESSLANICRNDLEPFLLKVFKILVNIKIIFKSAN
jgi:hypothetical protein